MKTTPSQAVNSLSHYVKALTSASISKETSIVRSDSTPSASTNSSQPILLTTPVVLRQLLSEHQSVHRLLPQLTFAAAHAHASSPLAVLLTHLSSPPDTLHAQQLRALVNQWFSAHPTQMLTSPSAQATSWLQALAPALLWLLRAKQHSSNRPGAQSTDRSTHLTLPNLGAALQQIKGSLHSIRLSQLHLTETVAQQHPEYYLCLPYQEQSKDTWLELLLKRESRQKAEQSSSHWHFTMRLNLLCEGPVLARGSYTEGQTEIKFYSQSAAGCDRLQQSLNYLRERLLTHGIEDPDLRVYQGNVPQSLAPYPKSEHDKDDLYAR